MTTHQLLSTIARKLNVSEGALAEFERNNWIKSVAKNGHVYLSGSEALKAKYILHLRQLGLSNQDIGQVLQAQGPGSYSLAELPKILGRPIPGVHSIQ